MNYKSFADLSKDIKNNLHKIPKDVTLVVGIPRSGLLAANLISLYSNLPLTDIDSFLEGKILCPSYVNQNDASDPFTGKILIVDDSVATGKAIVDARQKLKPIIDEGIYTLLFCCVYADPEKQHLVDLPLLLLNRPRLFEWNLFHNKIMEKSGVNLKGMLGIEQTDVNNPAVKKSFKSLLNVLPYIIPKKSIGTVFFAAPHAIQKVTEEWLLQNNVHYTELIVKNDIDLGLAYKKRKELTLFIESEPQDALRIFKKSGKDVYCLQSNTMYSKQMQGIASLITKASKRWVGRIKKKFESFK